MGSSGCDTLHPNSFLDGGVRPDREVSMSYDLLSAVLIREYEARELLSNQDWGTLRLQPADNWYEVLENAPSSMFRVRLNTGWVVCLLYVWYGKLYVFVPCPKDKPGAIERLPDGVDAHHGCYFGVVLP